MRELKPDYIAAAFDLPGPTFRHVAYERYKAQRPETPSDLSSQFSKARRILEAFGIPVIDKEGYEADDVIGTISKKMAGKKDMETIVVTGDMDALQLVGPRLKVYSMKKGITDTVIYDTKAVKTRFGFGPEQLVDYKGLKGDPSDNIMGVKGIGEKTATELIKEFGTVEGIYKAVKKGSKKISGAVLEKLKRGEEDAKFSKELATINKDAPITFLLEDAEWKGGPEYTKAASLFQEFGFLSLLKRINNDELRIKNYESGEKSHARQGALIDTGGRAHAVSVIKNESEFRKEEKKLIGTDLGILSDGENIFLVPRDGKVYEVHKSLWTIPYVKDFFEKGEFFVYDGKSVIKFLRRSGINPKGFKFDILLAAYVSGTFLRDFSYLAIASRELGRMISQSARDEFAHFFEVVDSLDLKLSEGKLRFIFDSIEMPLLGILADMEERGIKLDADFLKSLSKQVTANIANLTKKIHKYAGEDFNINSPQQLSKILFEKLKIKTHGLRKTEKEGRISTGAAELEKLKNLHPMVAEVLEYRELAKLKSTYIDALPELINKKTGRLHTTFNQAVTATGRLSSANPNIQNIPVMTELGREIRKAFVAEDGFLLISFDYSQIELRIAAHIADDKKMIEAFKKGMDVHKLTAAEIYNVPLDKVTPELRRAAKTLNFGVLYGMGSGAFAESTGMSREDARKFIDEYFHDFSGIKKYIEDTKRLAEEQGYVETIFGRRRYIPEIHSPNWQLKREAERMAVNMPIQGSATGDIVKLAMIAVDKWVKKEKLENDVRMLLQVHDELLFEINPHTKDFSVGVKKDFLEKATSQIKEIMEGAADLKVPLVVDVKAGKNWGEQEKI